MTVPRHAGPVRRGMTLVEILVAATIAVLIAGVALGIYLTVSTTLQRQTEWRRSWGAADNAIELLRRDLAGTLSPAAAAESDFALTPADKEAQTNAPRLALCSMKLPPGQTELRSFQLWRIQYEVHRGFGPSVLVRIAQPLDPTGNSAPSPPVREDLLRGIAACEWLLYDGQTWTNRWDSRVTGTLPQALRVRIDLGRSGVTNWLETELLIPAGISFAPHAPAGSPGAGPPPERSRNAATQTGATPYPGHSP